MRAVRGDCGYGCDVAKEEDAIGAGVRYIRKFSKLPARLFERSGDCGEEVATEVIFDTHRDLLEAQGA